MTVKEWFNRTRLLDGEIKSLKREISALSEKPNRDSVSEEDERLLKQEKVVRELNYKTMLLNKTVELLELKVERLSLISKIENPVSRTLLFMRYLSCFTWEEIAKELGCDARHVYRLHEGALKEAELFIEAKKSAS